MEVQIPLVLFTTFLAWSAGIFGTQCVLALRKTGDGVQMPALIVSMATLVVGGIAVFTHLHHWERIFNGFGHITSGITQELIAIVLIVVCAVVYFLMLRRDGKVPAWLAVVGLVLVAVLIVAMGHSYMMDSRPAWDSVLQLLSLAGAACVLGPATVAVIAHFRKVDVPNIGTFVLVGAAVNAVLAIAFLVAMEGAQFQSFLYYFDPTHPNYGIVNADDVSLLSGDCIAATVIAVLGLAAAVAAAVVARKPGDKQVVWAAVVVIAGLACTIALRVAMYEMGATVFMLF